MLASDIFIDISKYLDNRDWLSLRLTCKQIYQLATKKEIRKRKGIIVINNCKIGKFYSHLITESPKNILIIKENYDDIYLDELLKKIMSLEKKYYLTRYFCRDNFKFSKILSNGYGKKLAVFIFTFKDSYSPYTGYYDYIANCVSDNKIHNLTNIIIIENKISNSFAISHKDNIDFIYFYPFLNEKFCELFNIDWDLYTNITAKKDRILIYDTNNKKYYWNFI